MRLVGVGVVAHLANIGAAIFVVSHRHWTGDERFGGEQVHAETIEHAEGLRRISGGGGWNTGQFFGDCVVGRGNHERDRFSRSNWIAYDNSEEQRDEPQKRVAFHFQAREIRRKALLELKALI